MIELKSDERGSRRIGGLGLSSALFLALTACGGPTKKTADTTPKGPDPDAWKKQSLSLSVEGYMFGGGTQPSAASWSGSGAWIGPNLAVTNAHVALRGLKITGKDDNGKTYEFTDILAVNEEADAALAARIAAPARAPDGTAIARRAELAESARALREEYELLTR